ncbi:MAG: DegT/DnrJ/EryC1/StrS family aminotransferase [bacterium]
MSKLLTFEEALKRARRTDFLPYFKPWIGSEDMEEVAAVLKSGWLTSGERTRQFERKLKNLTGAPHVFAVSSCTAALHLSLDVLGIGPGDEVITSPLTFCSTVNVILHRGAKPVFVDIGPDLTLDVAQVEGAVTRRTRAVIPVHFGGYPSDLRSLHRLARERKFAVVEDAAHALGARHEGRPIGSFGDLICFSFYANKNLTTAEGGAVATPRAAWARKLSGRRLHGMSETAWDRYGQNGAWRYDVKYPGYKYNLSDVQSALGLRQFNRFESFQVRRREIADLYRASFPVFPAVTLPRHDDPTRESANHLFQILLDLKRLTLSRDAFIEGLREENIGANVHYLPVHLFSYYRETFGYRKGMYPRAEAAGRCVVSLPIYPTMTDNDTRDVIAAVARVLSNHLK